MDAGQSRGKINGVSSLAIVAAFLFANLLCVTPKLHERIHGSAVNHECAVTLVASGKYELSDVPPLAPSPQPFVTFSTVAALPAVSICALFLSASTFEHAPPALS